MQPIVNGDCVSNDCYKLACGQAPQIGSVTPNQGPVAGGTPLVIRVAIAAPIGIAALLSWDLVAASGSQVIAGLGGGGAARALVGGDARERRELALAARAICSLRLTHEG
jgi:hypothetical protein